MIKQITSSQNPYIKQLLLLKEKSRERKKIGLFVIEGRREITLAIKGAYRIKTLLFYPDLCSEVEAKALIDQPTQFIKISKEVYTKLAHRSTTEGLVAVAEIKNLTLNHISFNTKTPLILIAEAPEKPGNIGALLRTADAANVDAFIIANPKTDMYNPNIIRSSVGCIFTNKIAVGNTPEIISFLKTNAINTYCAALTASVAYHTQDYKQATAIVVGTEATGLSNDWLTSTTQNIIIPMQGEIDSVNLSVAAGIIIFEAKRQRQFK